jgi:hypothetical protein
LTGCRDDQTADFPARAGLQMMRDSDFNPADDHTIQARGVDCVRRLLQFMEALPDFVRRCRISKLAAQLRRLLRIRRNHLTNKDVRFQAGVWQDTAHLLCLSLL